MESKTPDLARARTPPQARSTAAPTLSARTDFEARFCNLIHAFIGRCESDVISIQSHIKRLRVRSHDVFDFVVLLVGFFLYCI